MRDVIRKILKEQTEVIIPNNKKVYVDRSLKMWETDPMSPKSFISTFGIDRDMAIYMRQKMAEQLSNVPIGKKIWTQDKDFPEEASVGNYDFKFSIDKIIDSFDQNSELLPVDAAWRDNMISKGLIDDILADEIMIDVSIYPEGSVDVNVQEEDGEYELKEYSIYDAIRDEDFGWEIESEIKDIVWFYICTFSPLALKFHTESDITLFDL